MKPAIRRLWAPWRAEYIYCATKDSNSRRSCLFCRLAREKDDRQNLLLWRSRFGFVVMNRFPYNNGHLMIAPYRHVASFERLKTEEGAGIFEMLSVVLRILRQTYRPEGFNVGANLGRVAGAGVAGHVHLHIVPRWQGDSNFMPLLAETKVVSEHLAVTYERLAGQFSRWSSVQGQG